jgi:hypothetical protein
MESEMRGRGKGKKWGRSYRFKVSSFKFSEPEGEEE